MNHYRVTTFQSGEICVIHFNGHMQLFFVTGFFYAIPFTVYNIRKRNRRQQKRYAMQKLKCANRRLLVMNINNADILHYIGIHHDNIQGPPPPPHTHTLSAPSSYLVSSKSSALSYVSFSFQYVTTYVLLLLSFSNFPL